MARTAAEGMSPSGGAPDRRRSTVAPVVPTPEARVRLRPIGFPGARIDAGFWSEKLRTNLERTIPHGASMLEACGNLTNFELAAGAEGRYQGAEGDGGNPAPFLDSDVYKWLEAVGWSLAQGERPELRALAEPMIELAARAQRPDGYVDSFYQVAKPGFDPSDAEELWHLTNLQDWRICESVQRGMSSRAYRDGWYAPMEDASLDIRRWLLPRLGTTPSEVDDE